MDQLEQILSKCTVLLAEDDEEVRKRLKNTLQFYFKAVYEDSNGDDAYDTFIEKKPDLLISDIEMSDGDGIELVKRIRKVNLNTPIIILSAYSKEEYLLKLINLKIDHYILKPTNNKQLFEAISKALLSENKKILELSSKLYLNIDDNTLSYQGQKIILRKKEKDFLELLYQNKHRITKYDILQEYIWGDKIMTQNALKTFIKELRRKLPIDIIKNVKQEGYIITTEN
ncbi:response regulator transcription factor [Sulfurospirillum sp. 1612]|uniref:response regulator transcription factor n=1 Tax=Sulfurospirillum sp. 1612 TaxID=3094835 RepID=UPI002F93D50B